MSEIDAQGAAPSLSAEVLIVVDHVRVAHFRVVLASPRGTTTLLETRDWQQAHAVAQALATVAHVPITYESK